MVHRRLGGGRVEHLPERGEAELGVCPSCPAELPERRRKGGETHGPLGTLYELELLRGRPRGARLVRHLGVDPAIDVVLHGLLGTGHLDEAGHPERPHGTEQRAHVVVALEVDGKGAATPVESRLGAEKRHEPHEVARVALARHRDLQVEVATGAEWFGLCRIRTDDTNVWEYMDATNVRLTDTGMCDERGAEVIVIRDGASVKVYLNGQKVVDAEDCTWLTADRATAPGLFTDCAVTQFEDVTFSYDLTELDDLLDEPSAGEEIGGLGDSPVGGVPAVGNWNALGDGGVQASGRSYTFLEGKGTSYVVQANLRVTMSGALPRPGLVVAQNAEWIVAACFNLSVAGTDYYGLLRVSTSDINTWEFDPYSVSSPAYGVRTEGAMLTAVRDGNDIWLFIDGRLVYRALDHAWLNETEETAAGLFNEDCTSEFTQVSFTENGVAEWIAKADMSRYGESVAIEGGERLIDSAYIIKDAEIAEASYAVQVTIRAEGTMGAQCRPGIIFGRHTANGLVFYETVSFSGDEWVGLMSVSEMFLIGDGAGLDCRDYVQKAGGYGLSAGITADLSVGSKVILCLSMYIGRIGFITALMVLRKRWNRGDDETIRCAPAEILVG